MRRRREESYAWYIDNEKKNIQKRGKQNEKEWAWYSRQWWERTFKKINKKGKKFICDNTDIKKNLKIEDNKRNREKGDSLDNNEKRQLKKYEKKGNRFM